LRLCVFIRYHSILPAYEHNRPQYTHARPRPVLCVRACVVDAILITAQRFCRRRRYQRRRRRSQPIGDQVSWCFFLSARWKPFIGVCGWGERDVAANRDPCRLGRVRLPHSMKGRRSGRGVLWKRVGQWAIAIYYVCSHVEPIPWKVPNLPTYPFYSAESRRCFNVIITITITVIVKLSTFHLQEKWSMIVSI